MRTLNQSTNSVKFGPYGIVLEKEQLFYYRDGNLFKVADVSYEFTNKDLFDLASRISTKNNFGNPEFTSKQNIISKK